MISHIFSSIFDTNVDEHIALEPPLPIHVNLFVSDVLQSLTV
jgi:hypothetical protein